MPVTTMAMMPIAFATGPERESDTLCSGVSQGIAAPLVVPAIACADVHNRKQTARAAGLTRKLTLSARRWTQSFMGIPRNARVKRVPDFNPNQTLRQAVLLLFHCLTWFFLSFYRIDATLGDGEHRQPVSKRQFSEFVAGVLHHQHRAIGEEPAFRCGQISKPFNEI